MISVILAILITIGAIYALIRRHETRLVLITAGLAMATISMDPLEAFRQFDKSMTNGGLIVSICSAMGFAAVVGYTKCDLHLVALLTKPLKKMGFMLMPICMVIVGIVAVAIPSTAGCCAAVAPTLIPLMVRSGFKPAMAAAAIICSIMPALFNPGVPHNVFVAKLANMDVMTLINTFKWHTLGVFFGLMVMLMVVCLIYKDYQKNNAQSNVEEETSSNTALPRRANFFYAIAPLVPVVALICASVFAPELKISVATAMLLGVMYTLFITRTNPSQVTKEFFNGMGRGYAGILGIIIAAGVFAAGLRAAGVIDLFINYLTQAQEVAKLGGALGPYLMGLITGSGDAATFAFNEAVTPYAAQFGMTPENLGYLATVSGSLGRTSSPLAGGVILLSGIAGVSPVEIVKRSAPAAAVVLFVLYFTL